MNPLLGWGLAALAVAMAWQAYGWQGAVAGLSLVVFWLLLQFNRSVRAMKNASNAPVGHVGSAVMLNAQLKAGMPMMQVIGLTKSLGRKLSDAPETWRWDDAGASSVTLVFDKGRLQRWTLARPSPEPEPPPPAP
jgi:hypothetical protein